ncbi:MAG: hypothetical protein IJM90_02540 [Firmicutes bacterium]|nr:hypothetical protein [Bacillota bacterium]
MKTTDQLNQALSQGNLSEYYEQFEDKLADPDKPFAAYMRRIIRSKGLLQQTVFLRADIPERYGYKLISEEKHTRQRDVILRLCLAAHCSLTEVNRALQLYSMSPLYPRIRRDAAFIIAFNTGLYEIEAVEELLRAHQLEPLYACTPADDL